MMVQHGEKSYCLSNIPSKNDYVVMEAAKQIEGQLRLEYLGEDLSTLGKFVRIARFGVIGHPDLEIKVRTTLRNVFELCQDTIHTLNEFTRTSQNALEILQSAYRYLGEAIEEQALSLLLELQEMSNEMKKKAGTLSTRCKEQSRVIKEVGDTTLQKKAEVTEEQKGNKGKIENEKEKEQADDEIKEAEFEKKEAQSELKSTSNKEEDTFRDLIKSKEDNQKKIQEYNKEMQKKREEATSNYQEHISQAEKDYESSVNKNEKQYLEQVQINKNKLDTSLLAVAQEYETALEKNKCDLEEKIKSNKKWLSDEIAKNKRIYNETISVKCKYDEDKMKEIERAYDYEISRIEQSLRGDLNSNEAKLNRELSASLTDIQKECEAKKKDTWFFQSGTRASHDRSKASKDVDKKTTKADADSEARDEKNTSDSNANSRAHDKKHDAYVSKESKLQPHRDDKQKITRKALQDQTTADNEACKMKETKDKNAEKYKQKADIKDKRIKDKKTSDATMLKQTEDDNALKEKINMNKEAKSAETEKTQKLENDYRLELQKLEQDAVEYKKELRSTSDTYATKLNDIKEKELKNQKIIDESKKIKKMAKQQMRKVVEQLAQCSSRAEIQNLTIDSLREALHALDEIEAIMKNVGQFWGEVEGLCETVTGRAMKVQIGKLSDMKPEDRKKIWKNESFKKDALNFYGKWIALKEVCIKACGNVNSALGEVRKYMVESPKEDEAFQSMHEMLGNLLKEVEDS